MTASGQSSATPEGGAYCEGHDGVRLWLRAVGEGVPIVCCNGIGVSIGFWRYFVEDLSSDHQVVVWDYRGHGHSATPPPGAELTIEANARDLIRVLDQLGIEQTVLVGHSMGVQVILEAYRQFPQRVSALVPVLGTYGHPVDTFFGSPRSYAFFKYCYLFATRYPERVKAILQKVASGRKAFEFARLAGMVDRRHIKREDLEGYLQHLTQLDPALFFRMALNMQSHSAEDILPAIDVPTLVVAGERDQYTPIQCSQTMHERIPGAEMLVIPGGSHAALVEQPGLVNGAVRELLRRRLP